MRLGQLAGTDPAEIVMHINNEDIDKLWAESESWQRACGNFWERLTTNIPKAREFNL